MLIPAVNGCRRCAIIFSCFLIVLLILLMRTMHDCSKYVNPNTKSQTISLDKNGNPQSYDRSTPIIFIGGYPRSGTTLMRSMLDAHSQVRCGEETRIIPRILEEVNNWKTSRAELRHIHEAGISDNTMDDGLAAFILEIIVKHGELAPRLCNKDPFTLKYGRLLSKLFPESKLIFMIRDGRAAVHSAISRNVHIQGAYLGDYNQSLTEWSDRMAEMLLECDGVGENRCLRVKYEDLVLHPKPQMERILKYLNLDWEESVLHHEEFVNKSGGISLSKSEVSTDQVKKPVYLDSLSKWVGAIPRDIVQRMGTIAPMLEKLGYDPRANPPTYGTPDI